MSRPLALLAAAALALAGCGGGGDKPDRAGSGGTRTEQPGPKAKAKAGEPAEAGAIRAWIAALNAGKYRRAADFFAKGAIVEQSREIRLKDRAAAIAFNLSLPCRADVTEVKDEGRTVIAAFRLRDGPRARCDGGNARVRFRFRGGKFAEWRQLAEPGAPPGQSI